MIIRSQQARNSGGHRCRSFASSPSNPILYGLVVIIVLFSIFHTVTTLINQSFYSFTNSNLDKSSDILPVVATQPTNTADGSTSFHSSSYYFSSRPPPPPPPQTPPVVRIVMLLGIEGTGHHFWQDLMKESPLFSRLKNLNIYPRYTKPILRSLYRHKKARWNGLWSATCKWNQTDPSPNITDIHETLVDALQNLTRHVETTRTSSSSGPVIIPINLLGSGNEFGFVSYPGFLRPCRALSYPNIDVWMRTCQAAKVSCEHVYIYRNPYSVIRSTTTNRPLNEGVIDAIHLYTTQLHVLHTQLLMFPHQLIGCLDYDSVLSPIQFRNEINPLYSFPDEQTFVSTLKKVFIPKKPPTTEERQREIVPAEYDLYMQSMIRAHDMVIQTCTNLVTRNRMTIRPGG